MSAVAWAFLVGFCTRGVLGHLWVLRRAGLRAVAWLCDVKPADGADKRGDVPRW